MCKKKVMVCVTRQKNCERLIHHGATFAKANGLELMVVHALRPEDSIMGEPNGAQALEYLFSICRHYNATMTMVRSKDTLDALVKCAETNDVSLMIMGASPQKVDSIVDRIRAKLPAMKFMIVEATTDVTGETALTA